MSFCTKCGKQLTGGKFCAFCGAPVESVKKPVNIQIEKEDTPPSQKSTDPDKSSEGIAKEKNPKPSKKEYTPKIPVSEIDPMFGEPPTFDIESINQAYINRKNMLNKASNNSNKKKK